jgi:hypothetical protein
MTRTALLAILLLIFPAFSVADDKEEKVKEAATELQRQNLLNMCEVYKINPSNVGTGILTFSSTSISRYSEEARS